MEIMKHAYGYELKQTIIRWHLGILRFLHDTIYIRVKKCTKKFEIASNMGNLISREYLKK